MSELKSIHRLLCFAHRGEAKAFLQELSFRPHKNQEHLYHLQGTESLSLVLTGEGSEATLINLTQAIVTLREQAPEQKIEVINMGVCGALKDHPQPFSVNDVVEVTTCYAQDQFKSYTSHSGQTTLPHAALISTKERVLDSVSATKLSHFAPLVDREAWSVGRVCQELKIPFRIIKVISDFADGDICARVKEDTELWSDTLLRTFLNLDLDSKEESATALSAHLPELHITLSQERKLTQLFKALSLKGYNQKDALEAINYHTLVTKEIRPKEKTKELTLALQELLNPLEKKLKDKLAHNTRELEAAGFKVSFDQGLEQEKVNLQASIESEAQINKLIGALESYDLMELRNILRGKDV